MIGEVKFSHTHTHTRTHLVNMLARGEADARLSPRRRRFHGDADDYMLVVGDYMSIVDVKTKAVG